MLYGRYGLPGVWVGAFLVNVLVRGHLTGSNLALGALIATGNALEAIAIAVVLNRVARFRSQFDRVVDVLWFIGASALCPVISATCGVLSLHAFLGADVGSDLVGPWLTWWTGDVLGALIIAPLVLTARNPGASPGSSRAAQSGSESGRVAPVLAFVALAVFCSFAAMPLRGLLLAFVAYSALVWCALVLSERGLFAAVAAVAALAVAATWAGVGPFSLNAPDKVRRLFLLQACLGVIAATMMLLRSVVAERLAAVQLARDREIALIRAKKLSVLGELMSGLAHEISNPLTVIIGKSELAISAIEAGKAEPGALVESFRKIDATATRIERIVRSVRFFSRSDQRDPFQRVHLSEIFSETLQLCTPAFRSSNVRLDVETPGDELELECKPVQVAQVILNLLDNARAAAAESEGKWVRLAGRISGSNIEIEVTDSGPGVPPRHRPFIFNAFFTTKKPGEGTGLGLSVSERIVRRHRGTLTLDVTSAATRFVVQLPLEQGRGDSGSGD